MSALAPVAEPPSLQPDLYNEPLHDTPRTRHAPIMSAGTGLK
jgi:hypothetical protein